VFFGELIKERSGITIEFKPPPYVNILRMKSIRSISVNQ
jgi:hypothetical protein